MNLTPDETAILDGLCQGLKKREIVSALRTTSNLYNARIRDARDKTGSATYYELVAKYTAWRLGR